MELDLDFVRSQFGAFSLPEVADASFFENAGGSFACDQTRRALADYYLHTKVQPYATYSASATAGQQMDHSRSRWAEALGVATDEVSFGPSTSMNTYVLAQAFRSLLGPDDEIIVTNADHEANTGNFRRLASATGAKMSEWRIDPDTGLLDIADLEALLTDRTRLVTMPHCSNIVGAENPVAEAAAAAHRVGARIVVDGVSFAPHGISDVAALDADVYLFSLYKVYSVHQGLMVVRNGLLDELPNQGHHFNSGYPAKRLTPAGPDHAQEAAAGAVLDYIEATHRHHGGSTDDSLYDACRSVSQLWQAHEDRLLAPLLAAVEAHPGARLLGPATVSGDRHRCPTVAFETRRDPAKVARSMVEAGVWTAHGNFYAQRVIEGMGVDAERGVVRLSFVHYTSAVDVTRAIDALGPALASD